VFPASLQKNVVTLESAAHGTKAYIMGVSHVSKIQAEQVGKMQEAFSVAV
jgi:hypothetical protein